MGLSNQPHVCFQEMHKLRQYLRYLLGAKTKHGVHSPFVYDFVTQVLPHRPSDAGAGIEALRKQCLRDKTLIEIEDFGAGYGGMARPHIQKTLAQVTRSSARRRREGELLLRICKQYAPRQVLELGTNLGFSALYMLSGLPADVQFITLEGSKELSKLAQAHFTQFGFEPRQVNVEFDAGLRGEIDWTNFKPGLVLLDGNHRKQATLGYFEFLLPRFGEGAIVILDDIYWSGEMTEAWREICAHTRVTASVDLFGVGICFLDRPQAKEHFVIRWH